MKLKRILYIIGFIIIAISFPFIPMVFSYLINSQNMKLMLLSYIPLGILFLLLYFFAQKKYSGKRKHMVLWGLAFPIFLDTSFLVISALYIVEIGGKYDMPLFMSMAVNACAMGFIIILTTLIIVGIFAWIKDINETFIKKKKKKS